jgi:hypothetical protein
MAQGAWGDGLSARIKAKRELIKFIRLIHLIGLNHSIGNAFFLINSVNPINRVSAGAQRPLRRCGAD